MQKHRLLLVLMFLAALSACSGSKTLLDGTAALDLPAAVA